MVVCPWGQAQVGGAVLYALLLAPEDILGLFVPLVARCGAGRPTGSTLWCELAPVSAVRARHCCVARSWVRRMWGLHLSFGSRMTPSTLTVRDSSFMLLGSCMPAFRLNFQDLHWCCYWKESYYMILRNSTIPVLTCTRYMRWRWWRCGWHTKLSSPTRHQSIFLGSSVYVILLFYFILFDSYTGSSFTAMQIF